MRRSVLIVKCGSADRSVAGRFGDNESWFIRALGGDPSQFTVVAPGKGEPLPDPTRCSAILVTGSTASVLERRSWMLDTGDYLIKAGERKVPVLAVGFGCQLMAEMLGVPVARSARGREFGTVELTLTADGQRDPLFQGLHSPLRVQANHDEEITQLPAGATLLATNGHSPVQAFAHGEWLRGLQFHPELWVEPLRALATLKRIPPQHFAAEETTSGKVLLRNFHDHFIVPRSE